MRKWLKKSKFKRRFKKNVMKKVNLKDKKVNAIIYCRGARLNPKGLLKQELKQELFCKDFLQKDWHNLAVSIKTFSENEETSPIYRPIFQKMMDFSKKNQVEMWVMDKLRRIAPKKNDFIRIHQMLKQNNLSITLLFSIEAYWERRLKEIEKERMLVLKGEKVIRNQENGLLFRYAYSDETYKEISEKLKKLRGIKR